MHKKNGRSVQIIAFIIAVAALIGVLAGCSATVPDPVIAKIGNIDVHYSTYYNTYASYKSLYSSYGLYDVSTKDKLRDFQDIIFDAIVNNTVPIYQAKLAGVTLTEEEEAEVQLEYAEKFEELLEDYYAEVDASITDEAQIREEAIKLLKKAFKDADRNYNDYLNSMLDEIRDVKIADKYISELISVVTVSDEDVRDYYDEQIESQRETYAEDPAAYYTAYYYWIQYDELRPFVAPEGYYAFKHILVKFAEDGEDKDVDAIVATIQQKLSEGEDFDTLIADYNEDEGMNSEPYKTDGYILGEANKSSYYESFAEAALALENIGDISEPVESKAGIHIIKKIAEVSTDPIPFEDVKDDIENVLFNTRQRALYNEYLAEWIENTKITKYYDRVSNIR